MFSRGQELTLLADDSEFGGRCRTVDVLSRATLSRRCWTRVGDLGQMALLTKHYWHPEQNNAVDLGGYWDDYFAETYVFYGHVLGFKGLERPVVALAVNGSLKDAERAKETGTGRRTG